MRSYSVEFVESRSVTSWIPLHDAFKFRPAGKSKWIQRLAWSFLNWANALEQAYEPKVTVTRHLIDADKFIERVIKQKHALFDGFNKEAKRLIIGSEDYAELMNSPEMTPHYFSFNAEVGFGRNILGLTVEVVPWMRGAVVMS